MSEKKITVMIQARTGSNRLSGKVLSEIENKSMIWHVINRIKNIKSVQQIVLITTNEKSDQILLDIAKDEGIEGFAGDTKSKRLVGDGGKGCYSCHTSQANSDFVFTKMRK